MAKRFRTIHTRDHTGRLHKHARPGTRPGWVFRAIQWLRNRDPEIHPLAYHEARIAGAFGIPAWMLR